MSHFYLHTHISLLLILETFLYVGGNFCMKPTSIMFYGYRGESYNVTIVPE